MQCMTIEDAIAWVGRNTKIIQGHTRKYLPFAPYDQEDFLQDAYEAALEAVKISTERQIPFPACFWIIFKGKISEVTPHPNSNRHAGSSSPPSTACTTSEFFDWGSGPWETLCIVDIDRLYLAIRKHLTPVEDKILVLALGLREGRKGIREIGRELGCSPANVRQTLNRIYRRLSLLVEEGQLQIGFSDVETRHLTAINGTSNMSGQIYVQHRAARAA